MQAVVKPASTAPCVARKPAPPAPTTTTSNVWSMNLYPCACVELMLFLDWLGLDTDLQHGIDIGDCDGCRKEIVQSYRDYFVPFVVDVVPELLRPCACLLYTSDAADDL